MQPGDTARSFRAFDINLIWLVSRPVPIRSPRIPRRGLVKCITNSFPINVPLETWVTAGLRDRERALGSNGWFSRLRAACSSKMKVFLRPSGCVPERLQQLVRILAAPCNKRFVWTEDNSIFLLRAGHGAAEECLIARSRNLPEKREIPGRCDRSFAIKRGGPSVKETRRKRGNL